MRTTLLKHGLLLMLVVISVSVGVFPQRKNSNHGRATMSPEERALVEEASGVVCTQAKMDPTRSHAIDEMQARPSLPVQHPDAQAGAQRAQKLLPIAKTLVISSLRQLVVEYNFHKSRRFEKRIQQAIARVNAVKRVRPDMESRD